MAGIVSRGRVLKLDAPQVMGILNVTPDSFSDGGRYAHIDAAIAQAERMIAEGATLIDVGGESTRPGAEPVDAQQELQRILPVIEALQNMDTWISVDTSHPEVMTQVARYDIHVINDVRGFTRPEALNIAAESGLALCIMHMQGEPSSMQLNPRYQRVLDDVYYFLAKRIQAASELNIPLNQLLIDPGFGFGKHLDDNLTLLAGLDRFRSLGVPLLAGLSRKSMIGALTGESDVNERLYGSLAAAVIAALKGAKVLRVHDVKPTVDALTLAHAVRQVED